MSRGFFIYKIWEQKDVWIHQPVCKIGLNGSGSSPPGPTKIVEAEDWSYIYSKDESGVRIPHPTQGKKLWG